MATPAYTGSNAVNSFNASSGTGAMSASVTSGNRIVVCVAQATGGTVTLSKSAGTATIGAFSQIGSTQNTGDGGSVSFWTCSVTGSGTLTLQLAASTSTFNGFTAMEWSNLTATQDGTPPAATVVATTSTGTTVTANSITTAQANSVVFGVMTDSGGGVDWTLAAGSGWSAVYDGSVVGNPSFLLYAVESSAGSYAPSGTLTCANATNKAVVYTVALQASGAAADPFPLVYTLLATEAANAVYRM